MVLGLCPWLIKLQGRLCQIELINVISSADLEGGGQGVRTRPGKSQVILVSIGISNWTPPPLEQVGPPPPLESV